MKSTRSLLLFILVALLAMAVPATFAQDPITLPPAVQTALQNTSEATSARFNFTLDIAATGEEPVELGLTGTGLFGPDLFQLSIEGELPPMEGMSDTAMPINAEIRGVNGSLYVFIPMLLPQWLEVSPEELQQGLNGAPIDLSDLGSMTGGTGDMASMMEMVSALGNYVTVTENGNVTSIDVDLVGALSDPAVQEAIVTQATAEDPSIDPAEIQEFFDVAPAALAGTNIHAEITVGPDNFVSNIAFTVNFSVDPSQLPPDAQEDMGLTEPTSLTVDFNLALSDYGGDFSGEVEAPADAMPLSQLMGAMMGQS